jgi:shikimate kinase
MTPDGPIFLTGFMGTGKSRIGRLLAEQLGREFYDTDQMVEARVGTSVSEVFASAGEARFRELEQECVAAAAGRGPVVIALGGGAVTQERNWELIRSVRGVVVCLEADLATIAERVARKDNRPLLAGLTPDERRDRIVRLLAEREPYYRRADVRVTTSNSQAAADTARRVAEALERWSADRPRGA